VDGLDIAATAILIREKWRQIEAQLRAGNYVPRPVRRVEIPKTSGGTRKLGVPTVLDRFIQQAMHQVLSPLFELSFSEHSYGFRPGRSAHQAVLAAREYQRQGKRWVVDIDLASFFDEVNHDLLIARVRTRVRDRRMLTLIRAYLNAGVMLGGLVQPSDKGTPQGGPLSPLLSNILLDQLDKELEARGHAFCRYADDGNIYVGSRRSGERVMASVTRYLEGRMKLKVNREKSAVDRPVNRVFLGYSFTVHHATKIRVPEKTCRKMRDKLKELFRMGKGRNLENFIQQTLNPLLRGWMNYFRLSETKGFAEELDGWIRRRLRGMIWRQWKRPATRFKRLVTQGLDPARAHASASNGRGAWFNSGASHMHAAFPVKAFEQMGLINLLDALQSQAKPSR
jgi:RNA-directed DNA polymerase